MNKRTIFFFLIFFFAATLHAQTVADSLAIVSASWDTRSAQEGLVHKRATFSELYRCPQVVDLIEIDTHKGFKVGIGVSDKKQKTSRMALEYKALAAINGSYFNVKRGNSVCFLKLGKQVIDTTTVGEFKLRVTGAVYERKGQMKLIPWSKEIEKKFIRKKGNILASGPLLLYKGRLCDWSTCGRGFIETKHPRSAVGITKDGKILLVAVNGRFPNRAEGMNIPELAHLLRVLGCKEALNVDGEGSTTLWSSVPSEGVVNFPCDNKTFDHQGERAVPTIIYIYR